MRANCPSCNTAYQVDDAKVPPGGARLKCSKCGTMFSIGGKQAAGPAAVPLPGNKGPTAVPLPGQRAAAAAVPLPGQRAAAPSAVPLPGQRAAPSAAVPLPGQARAPAGAAVPLPGGRPAGPSAAVPLPGGRPAAPAADEFEADLSSTAAGDDFDAMLQQANEPEPAPEPMPDSSTNAMDFGAPAGGGDPGAGDDPYAMDFGAPAGGNDFNAGGDPGAGNDPYAMDFGSPAPAGAPEQSNNDDNLEFDPTAPAPTSSSKPADDLEADLGAPIAPAAPAPQEGGDDLELLDFIDDAEAQAKSKNKGKEKKKAGFDGFQVRNRAGKVFGPMPEADVIKMLGQGKLLGNEEITRDGESWLAFGSHAPFAEALQKLMEAPGGLPGTGTSGPGSMDGLNTGEQVVDVNARIQQIYGGRMAGIVIVDSAEATAKIKKRIPYFVAGGVVSLILAFGIYLGFTPYGLFGIRHLFPKEIKQGSPLYAKIVDGRSQVALGTYAGFKKALADADAVLHENDQFVDARSLFVEAAYGLKVNYGDAPPEAVARAHQYVQDMLVAQKNDPDVIVAAGAESLALGDASELRPQLEKALAELTKKRPQGAAAAALELATSWAKARDVNQAKTYFEQAEKLGDSHVRALDAHASFLVAQRDPVAAGKILEQAVKEKPDHGPSALSLAHLRVTALGDPDHAEELVKPLAAGEKELSTDEQALLHAVLGMVRVSQKKLIDAENEFKTAAKLAPKSADVEQAYASYLLKRGLFDQAMGQYQDAYNQRPDDLDNLDGLVVSMVGDDQPQNAEKLVAEGNRKFPKSARVETLQGIVAEGEGKILEAEADYKTAIGHDAKYTRADLFLGRAYLKDGKVKEAHETLAAAQKKAPKDADINTAWGELAMAENRVDDALSIYAQAIALDNDNPRAHLGRARALLAKNQLPDALTEAQLAVKQDDHLPGAHKTLGDVLFAQGEFGKAKDEYATSLKQNGKDDEAYLMLGRSHYSTGDFDAAQTAFENAHTINSVSYHAYFWLALTHLKKHEITQAIEAMNKSLDNGGSSDPDVHYNFGLIYKAGDGHYNDALDEYKAALKLKPNYVEVLEALGDALFEANDFKTAQGYFEQAFNTDAKRTALLGKIGDCYAKQTLWMKAIETYNKHLGLDPTAVGDFYKIGNAYNELNKKGEAVAAYVKATSKDAKNAEAWRALGYAYKETNRRAEAVHAFKKYLEVTNNKAEDSKDIEVEIDGLGGK